MKNLVYVSLFFIFCRYISFINLNKVYFMYV